MYKSRVLPTFSQIRVVPKSNPNLRLGLAYTASQSSRTFHNTPKMGNSSSKNATYTELPPDFKLPREIGAWYHQQWKRLTLELGEEKGSPICLCDFPGGWYGDAALYAGPSRDGPRLATISTTSKLGSTAAVVMANERVEELQSTGTWTKEGYSFTIPAGTTGQPQTFAWDTASRDETAHLGESKFGGFKLMRIEEGGQAGETVAIWVSPSLIKSFTKAAKFELVGAGATGELGSTFTIMALASFIKIWQNRNARNVAAGGASAASGGVAAAVSS